MSDAPNLAGPPPDALAGAHARFARTAVIVYLGGALVALLLFVATLGADLVHEQGEARRYVLLETEVRAQHLARHLGLLARELGRLGLRSEVDLLDQNMEPERALLRLSQERSAFFEDGIAILGTDGRVAWAEPPGFLPAGATMGAESWFKEVHRSAKIRVVPVEPEREGDSMLYVVSPILRAGRFEGAILGAIDLARAEAFDSQESSGEPGTLMVATREGDVVYPPKRPADLSAEAWNTLMDRSSWDAFQTDAALFGRDALVASAPVAGSDLLLMSVVATDDLYGPMHSRLWRRLLTGVAVALLPLVLLVLALRSSLGVFRRAQQVAAREERLRRLGEAVNLIAHEIKNALNSMRLGLDLAVAERPGEAPERRAGAVRALRSEIERLTDFTTELLTLSRGITPRPARVDVANFVGKVVETLAATAAEAGIAVEVATPGTPVVARVDPSLLHSMVANLVGNALDALGGVERAAPRIDVTVEAGEGGVRIRVRDNGPGVPAFIRSQLFEPFVTGKPSGTGIGLALSRRIARAHGGDLVLEETVEGASFLVTLPVEGPA